jgi:hypothetical protein
MKNVPTFQPEYDLTSHEIARINHGEVSRLMDDRIVAMNADHILQPPYLSPGESERLGVAGSSYNNLLDFDHNQESALAVLSTASQYAYGTKRRVEKMYEEAYAANVYPDGPHKYNETQKAQDIPHRSLVSKLLGTLTLHFIKKSSNSIK